VAQPVGVHVNTFGTGRVADEVLERYILQSFRYAAEGHYRAARSAEAHLRKTAAYGHFGRDEFTWEKTDRAAKMADDLLRPVGELGGLERHGESGGGGGVEELGQERPEEA
jgi:S-adenosylmethionine synthetase